MRLLFSYARRYWLRYVFGILCTFANATLAMIIPLFIRDAINATDKHRPDLVAHYAELMIVFALMLGTVRWFWVVLVYWLLVGAVGTFILKARVRVLGLVSSRGAFCHAGGLRAAWKRM